MGRKKSPNHQLLKELDFTRDLLISGKRPSQIVRLLIETFPPMCRGTAYKRIDAVREIIKDECSTLDRHQLASEMIETYYKILDKALSTNQLNAALGSLAGLARLTGLVDKDQK